MQPRQFPCTMGAGRNRPGYHKGWNRGRRFRREALLGKRKKRTTETSEPTDLRIIGGKFRGSKLRYHGDAVTRPMKHRVREAIFNLVGMESKGRHAIDLFAGTGALGLEAISRGALSATFIEKHVPTARVIQENIGTLGVEDRATLLTTSAFLWSKRDLPNSEFGIPWLVFCSPPYAFFIERTRDMLDLIGTVLDHAPTGSIMIIEADDRFDFELLPGKVAAERHDEGWDVRTYPPAVVGVWRK
jgi:16S rRNA (guanine966-N2)-methyltransferase